MLLKWTRKKKATGENRAAQESMDKLSVWFCDALYTTNGLVTEIAAGHVVGIAREKGYGHGTAQAAHKW